MKIKGDFIFIIIILWLTGCMNLKHVTDYSDSSLTAAAKIEDLHYSFRQHCLDRCEMAAIDSFKIYRTIPCSCGPYRKADSVTRAIYQAITIYLEGLSRLSGNYSTNYRINPLAEAMKDEDLGVMQWNKEDADAYAALGNVVLRAVTDSYRQQKIREYIRAANPSLQTLLTRLEYIEGENLKGLLAFKKERLHDRSQMLIAGKGLNDVDRQNTAAEYYAAIRLVQEQQKMLTAYAGSLKTIGKGHQKLYDNVDKLSGDELKRELPIYAQDIRDLVAVMNQLNHH